MRKNLIRKKGWKKGRKNKKEEEKMGRRKSDGNEGMRIRRMEERMGRKKYNGKKKKVR